VGNFTKAFIEEFNIIFRMSKFKIVERKVLSKSSGSSDKDLVQSLHIFDLEGDFNGGISKTITEVSEDESILSTNNDPQALLNDLRKRFLEFM
jgi:hypothetical protein